MFIRRFASSFFTLVTPAGLRIWAKGFESPKPALRLTTLSFANSSLKNDFQKKRTLVSFMAEAWCTPEGQEALPPCWGTSSNT